MLRTCPVPQFRLRLYRLQFRSAGANAWGNSAALVYIDLSNSNVVDFDEANNSSVGWDGLTSWKTYLGGDGRTYFSPGMTVQVNHYYLRNYSLAEAQSVSAHEFVACPWARAAVLATAALVTACSGKARQSSAGSRTVLMPASWADGYPTLAAMKEHAEVVVRGGVTAISGHGEFNNAGTTRDPTKTAPATYTDSDGAIEVVEDDPLLEVGDHDVLFLRQFSPGHFFVMGGPARRFPISNGRTVSTMPGNLGGDFAPCGPDSVHRRGQKGVDGSRALSACPATRPGLRVVSYRLGG